METIRFSLLSIPFDIHAGRLEGHFFIFDDEELNLVTDFLEDTYQGRLLWIRGDTKTIVQTPLGTRYLNFLGHNARGYYHAGLDPKPKCSLPKVSDDKRSPVLPTTPASASRTQSTASLSTTDRMWLRGLRGIGDKFLRR